MVYHNSNFYTSVKKDRFLIRSQRLLSFEIFVFERARVQKKAQRFLHEGEFKNK